VSHARRLSQEEERSLLERLLARDEPALGELYDLLAPWVLGVAAIGGATAAVMPMDHDVPMVMTLEVPPEAGKVTGLAMSVEPRAGSAAPTSALVFRVEL